MFPRSVECNILSIALLTALSQTGLCNFQEQPACSFIAGHDNAVHLLDDDSRILLLRLSLRIMDVGFSFYRHLGILAHIHFQSK